MKLWLVSIEEDDWDYGEWVCGAIWANTPAEAERIARSEVRTSAFKHGSWPKKDELWLKPEWRVNVRPAPTQGVTLIHWHAG